jgi:hypothetical protein
MKIILFMLLAINLYASSLNPTKTQYTYLEDIQIFADNIEVHPQNWIGIYPVGSSSKWENMLRWTWTKETTSGKFTFHGLPDGDYEARLFYNNSFKPEAITTFSVSKSSIGKPTINPEKLQYKINEPITFWLKNMSGHPQDWVAIYPKNSSNKWENVIDWTYLNGDVTSFHSFKGLKAGKYEIRAFYKNSYTVEASYEIQVGTEEPVIPPSAISSSTNYTPNDPIKVTIKGFEKNRQDWIGIYPSNSSNKWENVVAWKWVDDAIFSVNQDGILEGVLDFKTLPKGNYEVRSFFNNSFTTETFYNFVVLDRQINKDELLQKAQTHCLNKDNSTGGILCANDNNSVYILRSEKENTYLYHEYFKVSLDNQSVSVLESESLAPWEQYHEKRAEYFVKKFENSPIFITRSYDNFADERGEYTIHANDKRVFTLSWYERNPVIDEDTLRISDDGKVLHMERTYYYRDETHKEQYDISDLNNIKLLSRDIINTFIPQ